MNSPRSARLNAQVSTTCSPWVLMTVTVCPAETKAAFPRRAGISMGVHVMLKVSRSEGDHVDLDNPAPGKRRHAHRGSAGTLVVREIGRKDFIHLRVIAIEVGQEDAHENHVGKREPATSEHAGEIIHHLAGLGLDARWNWKSVI